LNSGDFNFFRHSFQRFMRITPVLAALLIIYFAVFEVIVQRYPYAFFKDLLEPCQKHWLSLLFHVQNQVNEGEKVCWTLVCLSMDLLVYLRLQCLIWTWFLDVDWQMFLIAPLIICSTLRLGRRVLILTIALLIAISMWYTFKTSMEHGFTIRGFTLSVTFNFMVCPSTSSISDHPCAMSTFV
jgi:peptidoglycan/LPS O-acetylase OafA/YrhL